MATCLFHQNGRMEYWNIGILGIKAEVKHYNCKKLISFNLVQYKRTYYSITPSFLTRETFFYFTGAIIPIGAKPLSSSITSAIKLSAVIHCPMDTFDSEY
ncbi:MAG: hypothetical protein SRB2_01237 [Desulfobacteraceae bacterium Eth-SRB2]|nr:MAG: hypothetical protein SRB2_01237 [Desulfobacteraceae bacterium Eth-SRB2]